MEYYSALEIKETLSFFTTCMKLEHIMLIEVSQTHNNKYHKILPTYRTKKVEFRK